MTDHKTIKPGFCATGLALVFTSFGLSPALAQGAQEDEVKSLGPVIVTAQRREQDILDVPLSLSVIGAEDLGSSNSTNVSDLTSLVPNLAFSAPQSLLAGEFSIRGISSSANSPGLSSAIAVSVDDVFLARPGSFNSNLADIERIEVLRGPQGTLFGKNSTGGVLNIITKQPSLDGFEGSAKVRVGNFNLVDASGYVTGPVSDRVAFKVSASSVKRDGYISNRLTGEDEFNDQNSVAIRGQVLVDLDNEWELLASLDWAEDDNIGDKYDVANGSLAALDGDGFDSAIASDADNFNTREDSGGSLRITGPIGAFDFTSVTAYRTSEFTFGNDLDFTEASLIYTTRNEDSEQFSQEFRLSGELSETTDFIVGAYFETQSNESVTTPALGRDILPAFELPRDFAFFGGISSPDLESASAFADIDRTSYAVFGSLTKELSEKFTLQAGGRVTFDEQELKRFEQTTDGISIVPLLNPVIEAVSDTQDETAFSGDLSLTYALSENVNAYGRISRGFKGGGYNVITLSAFTGVDQISFEPEYVTAYEAGLKGRLSALNLSGSAAVYYYDYTDKQEQVFNGIDFFGLNAQAEVTGFEADLRWSPTPIWSFFGGVGYSDATYDEFEGCNITLGQTGEVAASTDCTGNDLVSAPKWTGFLGADFQKSIGNGLQLEGRIDSSYRDSIFFSSLNLDAEESEAYWLTGARLGIASEDGPWSFYIWGENIFDDDSVASAFSVDFIGTNYQQLVPPQTLGVEVGLTF